jgi:Cu/Ag efflux protein CusF
MMSLAKWGSALAAIVFVAGTSFADDAIISGKVKDINAEKKSFTLTDSAGKDHTIKFGDATMINREGKESNTGLKAGDNVSVCHDKGTLSWTAHYVLVRDGDKKGMNLHQGTFKSYDADKKQIIFTDHDKKDWTYNLGEAPVRLNNESSKVADLKVGDKLLMIFDESGEKPVLKQVMAMRK